MKAARTLIAFALTVSAALPSAAQSVAGPVRQLPAATATSTETLGSLAAVRAMSDGSVLVNDQNSRRVLLLDPQLKLVRVAADSTPLTNNAYGARPGGLIAFKGDSSIFVDPASLSLLLIDPAGKIIRTMAAPRPNDVNLMIGGAQAPPGFDSQWRLVYRGRTPAPPMKPNVDPVVPDSAPVVRVDLATRKIDTLTYFKIQKTLVSVTRDAAGNINGMNMLINNVLPVVDDWAMLTDGTVAVVRGRDYRLDLYAADGTVTHAAKIPYDWERLTDERKVELLDSTRAFREKARAQALAAGPAQGTASVAGRTVETRMSMTNGVPTTVAAAPSNAPLPPIILPEVSDLPDYRPAFGVAGVRADMDNRVWIRTTAVLQSGGGAIYDVIDHTGKRVDRVQLPLGSTIAGFGPGVVYLGFRDDAGVHIKKAPIK